jgi:hypothetical protein
MARIILKLLDDYDRLVEAREVVTDAVVADEIRNMVNYLLCEAASNEAEEEE